MNFELNIEKWIHKRWAWHLALWVVFYGVTCIGFTPDTKIDSSKQWLYLFLENTFNLFTIYVAAWLLLPYFLYQKKYILYGIGLLIATYTIAYFDFFVFKNIFKSDEAYITNGSGFDNYFISDFWQLFFFFLIFGTTLKFAKDTILNEYERQKTDKQRLIQEASFLRTQLSSHFLLNSVNNLYGLSLIKDERLPDLMLRLSELLRYSLYDTKDDVVSLRSEFDYLKSYIELMKIRLSSKVILEITLDEKFDESLKIAPMILATYVENTFKHIAENTDKQRFIHIQLLTKNTTLYLKTKNSHNPDALPNMETQRLHGGIGLENTKRRLELLYPEKHELNIITTDKLYDVALRLELS